VIRRGFLTIQRHPTPILGGIILALIVGLVIALNWAGRSSPSLPTGVANSRSISAMHFLSSDSGWVLSTGKLLMTRDGGARWRDVTPGPAEPPTTELRTARFLDPARGWTVAIGAVGDINLPAHTIRIFRTTDGGTTWKSSDLTVDAPLDSSLDFVDAQHGWLVVATQTPGPTSAGQLFQTADGGATWSALASPPSGHAVRFISLSTGWTVGGANFDQLYVTRDGGHAWQQQRVPVPAAYADTSPALDLPAFVDAQLGALRVMFADGSVQLDLSVDGGETWTIDPARAALLVRQPPYPPDEGVIAPTFVGNGVMAVVLGRELKLQSGGGWISVKPHGFDSINEIEFVNPRVGWAVRSTPPCHTCVFVSQQELLRTVDGGRSWTAVPVRSTG
jgi:photosystem II stability/assembly factor-like uncharacterized protein